MKISITEAESRIAAAYRHVRQGERTIARQRTVVARLDTLGYPTAGAQALLETFEKVLVSHRVDLDRLVALRNRLASTQSLSFEPAETTTG